MAAYGLMTWSVSKDGVVILVTAETVEIARQIIALEHDILVSNAELVPVVTHSRWCRVVHFTKET
jgi:hypothetical protein